MNGFNNYLNKNKFKENTVNQYINYCNRFLDWLKTENLNPKQATYNDIIVYIDYCKTKNYSIGLINQSLVAIRHYYNYLGINNIAYGIYIKGGIKTIPSGLLHEKELEDIYNNFKTSNLRC